MWCCCCQSSGPTLNRKALGQWSPTFLAPGTSLCKTVFPWTRVGRMVKGWSQHITFTVIVFLWLLHQLHLLSSGIKSWKLGTPALECWLSKMIKSLSVQLSHSVMSDSLQPHGCSPPGLPVHHQLPELAQTHVHGVSDAYPKICTIP